MATTRSQTHKMFKNTVAPQNRKLNNSYVSIVCDDTNDNKQTVDDINCSLRNELASLNFELLALSESKLSLEKEINNLRDMNQHKDDIINYLKNTIEKLTRSSLSKSVSHMETQTQITHTNDTGSQTFTESTDIIPLMIEKSSTTPLNRHNVNVLKKTDTSATVKTSRAEEASKDDYSVFHKNHLLHENTITNYCKKDLIKSKILLLADSQGRSVGEILRNLLPNWHIDCIFKPNANFEGVVSDVANLTENFTKNDTVIISAGSNDALRGAVPAANCFYDILSSLSHTNVIFVSVPYCRNRYSFNNYAYEINSLAFNVIHNYNLNFVQYIDTYTILQKPLRQLHFSRSNKENVYSCITKIIDKFSLNSINEFVNFKNLTYVTVAENLTNFPFL